jgi:microcystin-dependent protein
MSQPFVGEIRCFGFQFAPANWAFCNGQLTAISQNPTLYSLIGTTYGGDGQNTFALPDLRGRVPMHWGTNIGGFTTTIGQPQGQATVTLTLAQTPSHTHAINVGPLPAGGVVERTAAPKAGISYLSDVSPDTLYKDTSPTFTSQFASSTLSPAGSSQSHDNMQPYLTLSFCMAMFGVYPSRN